MKWSTKANKYYCSALCWKNNQPSPAKTGDIVVLEELQDFRKEFNERFDAMAEFFSKKLK